MHSYAVPIQQVIGPLPQVELQLVCRPGTAPQKLPARSSWVNQVGLAMSAECPLFPDRCRIAALRQVMLRANERIAI
jgi:hypothetical protein